MALKTIGTSGFLSRVTLGVAPLLLPLLENSRIVLPLMIAASIGYALFGGRDAASDAPLAQGVVASTPMLSTLFLIMIAVAAATFPLLPFANRYLIVVAILILIYVMLGWGLNVVVGLAGLLDLGYVAFYAVGAYSFALLATKFGLSFWICLPLAGILAACWGIILGFPVLRLRGDYLAIVTLAFGEIIRLVLINWQNFTGGPAGIGKIPMPSFPMIVFEGGWPKLVGLTLTDEGPYQFAQFFGIDYVPVHRFIWLYYIILALALLTNYVTLKLRRLPIGRAWEALREDEIACRSLGVNTTNTKLTAFAIGAMFGGIAGSFYATWQGYISPDSFVFMESAIILSIVVLGGMGSQIGVAAAAVVMIGGIEVLRNLQFANTLYKAFVGGEFDPNEYRMLVFGIAMVLIMLFKPRGFVGARTPTVFLKDRRAIGAENVKEGHG
jgi:branched-chain amino acid transport system permease protein